MSATLGRMIRAATYAPPNALNRGRRSRARKIVGYSAPMRVGRSTARLSEKLGLIHDPVLHREVAEPRFSLR